MKPSIILSDAAVSGGHPAVSKEPPIKPAPAVVSPIRRVSSEAEEHPLLLRPLTVHSESIPSLSPPLYGTGHPASNGANMMASSPMENLKKPKRPLTAYHIYFQIEREFIIQNMAGDDADKSIHEGKILFDNVPKRYANIKLSPDWYFAPGKRAKRKHRKQHGKIGFLELSKVITSRWAKLAETDPDIKQFVSKLAQQENEEYKREMKEYRENLAMSMKVPFMNSTSGTIQQQPTAPQPQVHQHDATMPQYYHHHKAAPPRISSFPLYDEDRFVMTNPPPAQPPRHQEVDQRPTSETEYSSQQRTLQWGKPQPDDDFDHCISLLQSSTFVSPDSSHRSADSSSPFPLDPLNFWDDEHKSVDDTLEQPATKKQRVDDFIAHNYVDICDDDIMSMWKSTNSE